VRNACPADGYGVARLRSDHAHDAARILNAHLLPEAAAQLRQQQALSPDLPGHQLHRMPHVRDALRYRCRNRGCDSGGAGTNGRCVVLRRSEPDVGRLPVCRGGRYRAPSKDLFRRAPRVHERPQQRFLAHGRSGVHLCQRPPARRPTSGRTIGHSSCGASLGRVAGDDTCHIYTTCPKEFPVILCDPATGGHEGNKFYAGNWQFFTSF